VCPRTGGESVAPCGDWNLGRSTPNSDSSHTLKPDTFIGNAELQIALIVVAVFGGAVGVYKWVHCHHGMACRQVAEGGTACSMEGGCECIE
jgi:hypothetical protein